MKFNTIILSFSLVLSCLGFLQGQTTKKTLNYQAVILDPNAIDIPGASIVGQPLHKGKVCLRFSFFNTSGGLDYEETQQTTTDEYGLVNISIGAGSQSTGNQTSIYKKFEHIIWDANVKTLKVSVSYNDCKNFNQVSSQTLNYTPYALYAESVDYKNVRDAPTKLSQFSNDVGYLIPKDLDPLKVDINNNTSQIAASNQAIVENKNSSDSAFLIVKQRLSSMNVKIIENSTDIQENKISITSLNTKVTDQQNQIFDNRNQITITSNNLNSQIDGLQTLLNSTNSTLNNLSGVAEIVSNKSISTNLGGSNPSDQLYPSQKAAKSYIDNAIITAVGSGVPDATTVASGKIVLAGDLGGTAANPTVPALASKENLSNKSTAIDLGAGNPSDNLYPSQKATKSYVDNAIYQVVGTGVPDATTNSAGKIKLAGDLAGTAFSPTVPGLTLKEDLSNKSNSPTLGTSTSAYPTQNAVKTYVDNQIATSSISGSKITGDITGNSTNVTGIVSVANGGTGTTALNGYVFGNGTSAFSALSSIPVSDVSGAVRKVNGISPNASGEVTLGFGNVTTGTLANRPVNAGNNGNIYVVSGDTTPSNNGLTFISDGNNWSEVTANLSSTDARYVQLAGSTMNGNLTFPTGKKILISDLPTGSTDAVNKLYVDSKIQSEVQDATSTISGKIKLTGDLGGNASAPVINNGVITYGKIQNVSATNMVLGRVSAGSGPVEEISTTGSGNVVRATSPILVSPNLGTPSSINLSNANGLPLTSGVSGILPVSNGGTGSSSGSITGSTSLTFAAGGTNQNINLNPSGSGSILLNGSVSIGTNAPASSAALEISSTTKLFYPPRMTTTERDAIVNANNGGVIYNTTLNKLQTYTVSSLAPEGTGNFGTYALYAPNVAGQTIQPISSGRLNSIKASVSIRFVTDDIRVNVYDGVNGNLLGTADAVVNAPFNGNSFNWVVGTWTFSNSNINLNANSTYYFEFSSVGGRNFFIGMTNNSYPRGSFYQGAAGSATIFSSYDIDCAIYYSSGGWDTTVLPVANGGTGAATLSGLIKGNGSNAFTTAIAGTDYQAPLTLTTTGSGAATLTGNTLNIPVQSSSSANAVLSNAETNLTSDIPLNVTNSWNTIPGFDLTTTTSGYISVDVDLALKFNSNVIVEFRLINLTTSTPIAGSIRTINAQAPSSGQWIINGEIHKIINTSGVTKIGLQYYVNSTGATLITNSISGMSGSTGLSYMRYVNLGSISSAGSINSGATFNTNNSNVLRSSTNTISITVNYTGGNGGNTIPSVSANAGTVTSQPSSVAVNFGNGTAIYTFGYSSPLTAQTITFTHNFAGVSGTSTLNVVSDQIQVALTNNNSSSLTNYINANTGDWIEISQSDYNYLNTNVLSSSKYLFDDATMAVTGSNSPWGGAGMFISPTQGLYPFSNIPSNNVIYAFSIQFSGATSISSGTKIYISSTNNIASTPTQLGGILPAVTNASSSNAQTHYFVIKKNTSTLSGTQYLGLLNATGKLNLVSGTGMYWSSAGPLTNLTLYNGSNAYFTPMQVLATPTLQW
jgi:hypothetical protein